MNTFPVKLLDRGYTLYTHVHSFQIQQWQTDWSCLHPLSFVHLVPQLDGDTVLTWLFACRRVPGPITQAPLLSLSERPGFLSTRDLSWLEHVFCEFFGFLVGL